MLNRDIYAKLPQQSRLVNEGVARVSEDWSEAAEKVLRYEVETFVCSGQYEKGLSLILDTFVRNLGSRTEQPGVWISGFYGSGKSHLAKMLRALWVDHRFSDGATARGIAQLPTAVSDALRELTTQSRRAGGLHAAAGNLGEGADANVRLALLGIVFKSAGLPEQYHQARFVMWLKREGLLEAVEAELAAHGRTLVQELPDLYVSDYLAGAVRKARPAFADSDMAARLLFEAQFPQVTDITLSDMVDAITKALSRGNQFPLTLIVLDEVQQFVGTNASRAFAVQEVTETLSKRFSGLLLFVGTGQSALSGTSTLQRLLGRFPVTITLGDWEVEKVTREVILRKKESMKHQVTEVLRSNLGEISRHLHGTKLEHVTTDEAVLMPDYPILPVRRRFWERVLRAIDETGTISQLRNQLRVVHEAVVATADRPLGHVVPADFLYDQNAATLVSTAKLPKEVFENVQLFSAGDPDSQLKAKLLKLIYLVNMINPEVAQDIGLRSTDDVLADLLVEDLGAGSAELRKRLPALLDELQNKDKLIMALQGGDGIEYRLQTQESKAWYDEFRAQQAELQGAPQRVDLLRADLLKARFREILAKVRVTQGKENVARTLTPSFDETLPKDNDKQLYIWIQDGWQNEEKSVIADARAKGADNPTLFAFLPAQNRTDLDNAIIAREAADRTLVKRGQPSTDEGRLAQSSMETRKVNADKELVALLDKLFSSVRLFQAGGQEVTEGADLAARINGAAKTAAIRLYREFDVSDHLGWSKVIDVARTGSLEALKQVGHNQEPDKHPVCQQILQFIGAGKKGGEIRDKFIGAPYGWSRDVIDGALYALMATGHLRAIDSNKDPVDAKSLERSKLTQASFYRESITITPPQKIKIRTMFNTLGVVSQLDEVLAKAPQAIASLRALAAAAGGAAPAPASPKHPVIQALESQSGNGLLLELYSRADEITQLASQWTKTAEAIRARLPEWHQLINLLAHAAELPSYGDIRAEVTAIEEQRRLLDEPNPVHPLLQTTTDLLRQALNAKVEGYRAEFERQTQLLQADAAWQKLTDAQREQLLKQQQLAPLGLVELSTATQLQEALDSCSLAHWADRIQALGAKFDAVRRAAAKLLEPNIVHVHLPKRTLNNAEDLKRWLTEVEALLEEHLKKGPVAL